jgi:hypothetical protein
MASTLGTSSSAEQCSTTRKCRLSAFSFQLSAIASDWKETNARKARVTGSPVYLKIAVEPHKSHPRAMLAYFSPPLSVLLPFTFFLLPFIPTTAFQSRALSDWSIISHTWFNSLPRFCSLWQPQSVLLRSIIWKNALLKSLRTQQRSGNRLVWLLVVPNNVTPS